MKLRRLDALHSIVCAVIGVVLVLTGRWDIGLAVLAVVGSWELLALYQRKRTSFLTASESVNQSEKDSPDN